ncbi:MAG: gluconate 2-dehydrogenase subunit 3 family protein [Blastocatellia bacterium]|nr:gluconate 2-dehydrogenase subunit 3 family protein [Blastocatellia bacterium]
MAGQNLERREMMRALSLAAGASRCPWFVRWAFAFHADDPGAARAAAGPDYKPHFFTDDEYGTIARLSELIIPSDSTPGAREAGASEFIDFIVFSDPGLQYPFRSGIKWIDSHARYKFGRRFREMKEEEQIELLSHLAYKDRFRAGEEDGREFFRLMREYAVIGFYTSRIGMEEIKYPGLKKYWREVPGCPHLDDPEHKHLPPGEK